MSKSVTLYKVNTPTQKVEIKLIISEDKLLVSGFDIGKTTKEIFGNSDYEYNITIVKSDIYNHINEIQGDKPTEDEIANWYLAKFYGNNCFSNIKSFYIENNLKYEIFFWR